MAPPPAFWDGGVSDNMISTARAAIEFMVEASAEFASAKAERIYLEEFRKTKKALLMSRCDEKAAVAREQFAYAHPEYQELLLGLRAAVEREEALKWKLVAAQARVDVWRTDQANARHESNATR